MGENSEAAPTSIIGKIELLPTPETPIVLETVPSSAHEHALPFCHLTALDPIGKILYADEAVIRQIYDCVSAAARLDDELARQLLSEEERNRYKQIASLEWNPDSDTNFGYLILLLSWILRDKKSTGELVCLINEERASGSKLMVIYPGMPIRVCGVVRSRRDVQRREIRLREDKFSVRIALEQEHTLYRDAAYLSEHFLFVLGIVQNIEKTVIIKAGALLL
jgi:hypothetical protein